MDPHLLEQVDSGIADTIAQPDFDAFPEFQIGTLVKERHIDLEGVIMGRNWHINGCLTLDLVSPKVTSNLTHKPMEWQINAKNAEVVQATKDAPVKPTKTGGPARLMGRNC